jgi:hypothetical protein
MMNNLGSGGAIPPAFEDDETILIASKSFAEFDQWMDDQLAKLVARWAPLAAPNASRVLNARERGAQVD